MTYTTDFHKVSKDAFCRFITKISDDFVPPLLPRIDIDDYYAKLKSLATIVVCIDEGNIVGLAATYCNNRDTKLAYTTLVGVDKDYRGRHIATKLMEKTKVCAKQSGMKKIGIHTNNPHARELYIKCGYTQFGEGYSPEIQTERYYLEIEL